MNKFVHQTIAKPPAVLENRTGLENMRSLVRFPARLIFFPMIDDSHCDRILPTLNVVHCDAHVFPSFLTLLLKQLSFQRHRLLFPNASAEVRGENKPERKFASTGDQPQNYQSKVQDNGLVKYWLKMVQET